MKKILVLNDFVSYGKISGIQIDKILSFKNYEVFFLPTALISNMFSLKKTEELDTSDYIRRTLLLWNDIGIQFDAIFIGFVLDKEQKDIIIKYLSSLKNNPTIIVDPIMADDGKLYNSLDKSIIEIYKEIIEKASVILPNITEAKLLTGIKDDNLEEIITKLSENNKKVIITSAVEETDHFVIAKDKEISKFYFEYIPISFEGSGDVFDGIFTAYYLENLNFKESIKKCVDVLSEILKESRKDKQEKNDIKIEKYLNLI